ncbi:unnamed protein product [Taenia asiatica]|uniref:Uncharacterized protein n=1 Tax=Taenia asiatica TaxID=60517 RepID=A0A0R3VYG3_TAEAS|nr:unnamed protein product [Taenia asiatica]
MQELLLYKTTLTSAIPMRVHDCASTYRGKSSATFPGNREDISNFVRVVNRPSYIKPHEWARLTGRSGLASFRFGNSTLCHRGEKGALGSLIRADATAELSHKMVINYDLAHVFNRYSLFQLTELFGGT